MDRRLCFREGPPRDRVPCRVTKPDQILELNNNSPLTQAKTMWPGASCDQSYFQCYSVGCRSPWGKLWMGGESLSPWCICLEQQAPAAKREMWELEVESTWLIRQHMSELHMLILKYACENWLSLWILSHLVIIITVNLHYLPAEFVIESPIVCMSCSLCFQDMDLMFSIFKPDTLLCTVFVTILYC